jgi:hypothetical protein
MARAARTGRFFRMREGLLHTMSPLTEAIHANSERFLPAFARITKSSGRHTRYEPLDLGYDELGPVPSASERELGRWAVIGGGGFTVTDAGMPLDLTAGQRQGRMMKLFYGGATVVLTDQRLLALVLEGDTVVGPVGGRTRYVLGVAFPLARVEAVTVEFKTKLLGGQKESGLHVTCLTGTVADLYIESVVASAGTGPKGMSSYRGTLLQILDGMVPAVVQARRAGAPPEDVAHLEAVLRGRRVRRNAEIAAVFTRD